MKRRQEARLSCTTYMCHEQWFAQDMSLWKIMGKSPSFIKTCPCFVHYGRSFYTLLKTLGSIPKWWFMVVCLPQMLKLCQGVSKRVSFHVPSPKGARPIPDHPFVRILRQDGLRRHSHPMVFGTAVEHLGLGTARGTLRALWRA